LRLGEIFSGFLAGDRIAKTCVVQKERVPVLA
jgi:hypothetical protein